MTTTGTKRKLILLLFSGIWVMLLLSKPAFCENVKAESPFAGEWYRKGIEKFRMTLNVENNNITGRWNWMAYAGPDGKTRYGFSGIKGRIEGSTLNYHVIYHTFKTYNAKKGFQGDNYTIIDGEMELSSDGKTLEGVERVKGFDGSDSTVKMKWTREITRPNRKK